MHWVSFFYKQKILGSNWRHMPLHYSVHRKDINLSTKNETFITIIIVIIITIVLNLNLFFPVFCLSKTYSNFDMKLIVHLFGESELFLILCGCRSHVVISLYHFGSKYSKKQHQFS